VKADKYQVLDPLTDEEYEDLRADIAEHGVMVPVTVDENGDILDGHHRMRAAAEAGKECPAHVVTGLTEDEKVDRAFSLNLKRRHMNNVQKRDAIGRYLRRRPEASDRLAAEVIGVTDKTVATVRKGLEETAEIPQFSPGDGRGRRTRKPEDPDAAAKRAAELEKSRAAGEKRQAKRDAERAEAEALTAAHMAPGGVMQGKRQVRAIATQDRIRAALTDCIVALTRALADPGLDEDLAAAEAALLNDDLRIVGKSAQVRRLARELDARLGELGPLRKPRATKTSRTERDSADRQ
jgi:ParB-like chromosome segregation protein Spo0J